MITVYHQTSTKAVRSVLEDGLRYGEEGTFSREEHAKRTNDFLDATSPAECKRAGLVRQKCQYAYLELEGKLINVDDGRQLAPATWRPGDGRVPLRLSIDPATAYVGDLDAYDRLAAAIEYDRSDDELCKLAADYWQLVHRLDHLVASYRLDPSGIGIVPKNDEGKTDRHRYERVEVMLTKTVPPGDISRLLHNS